MVHPRFESFQDQYAQAEDIFAFNEANKRPMMSEDEDEVQLRTKGPEISHNVPQFSPQELEKYQIFLKWLESEKNYESYEQSVETLKKPEPQQKSQVIEKVQEATKQKTVEVKHDTELRVSQPQYCRSVSPIEQRLDTVEQELKAFTLEKSDDEFLDVIDDENDDNSITEMSEPTASTVIENPDWTSQMIQKIETLAESLTKSPPEDESVENVNSPEITALVTVEPSNVFKEVESTDTISSEITDINLPKDIQVGQKLIHLEDEEEMLSDNLASDEEIVIESKLTISNTHVELTTLKTSSSQNSLNKIGSRRSSLSNSQSNLTIDSNVPSISKTSSLTNISDHDRTNTNEKPTSHGKGKAPVPPVILPKASQSNPESSKPPLPMRAVPVVDRLGKEKKRKSGGLFSSFTGIFKSDHSKDSDSHDDTPKETRI